MRIVVMKFGGTSVDGPARLRRAARRAGAERRKGRAVAVVVSAPGEMTDDLLDLAAQVCPDPAARELDQLAATGEQVGVALFALACRAEGLEAVSLTGAQAGIDALGAHGRALISRVRAGAVLRHLRAGRIAVVAGFQGRLPGGDVATLGRGGSDLTAVALAAALGAKRCEVFTDVRGVYTADPRVVPGARLIPRLGFEVMLELAGAGAQVMQARSIELAQRFGVEVHVRSAFEARPGTLIAAEEGNMLEKAFVASLALDKGEVRLDVVGVPDRPGAAAVILGRLAEEEVPVDMIIQSAPSRRGVNDISLLAPRAHAERARRALEDAARRLGAEGVRLREGVAKISVVGTGFRHNPRVAAAMFSALAAARINIHMIASTDLRVSCVVDRGRGEAALRAIHKAYGLSRRRR